MRKPIAPLNWPQSDVLRALANGAHICGQRTYPHPHRYTLEYADGTSAPLPANSVAVLIQYRLIDAEPRHRHLDVIVYRISSVGREAVRRGNVHPPVAEQTAFFENVR